MVHHSQVKPAIPSARPKRTAAAGSIRAVGTGRRLVRRIFSSMSRSATWLRTFAPAADKVPPINVATTSHEPGHSPAATTIAGTVVTSSNSMMRGLVNST